MKNYIQQGDLMDVTAPANVASGDGVQVGSLFGVAVHDAASGKALVIKTKGVYELKKIESQAWTVGAKVYWDNSEKECTTDGTKGMLIGVAAEAVTDSATATLGKVRLNGVAPDTAEGPQGPIADLTMGTNVTAATANGSLEDSGSTNPTEANFNNNMKELGVKINDILAALRAAGIIAPSS